MQHIPILRLSTACLPLLPVFIFLFKKHAKAQQETTAWQQLSLCRVSGEMTSARTGTLRSSLLRLLCAWICRIWGGRRPKSKKNLLLICAACILYGIFMVSQAGNFLPQKPTQKASVNERLGSILEQNTFFVDSQPDGGALNNSSTLQPNVVYITLRSKRSKPANIRGTVRPKKRRKSVLLVQNDLGNSIHQGIDKMEDKLGEGNKKKGTPGYKSDGPGLNILGDARGETSKQQSNIRIYSDSAPPWFSPADITTMRFLADSRIHQITRVPSGHAHLILFETPSKKKLVSSACQGKCGLVKRPLDMSEVFAFHLDRILGLNRSLPTVSRKFEFAQGERIYCSF